MDPKINKLTVDPDDLARFLAGYVDAAMWCGVVNDAGEPVQDANEDKLTKAARATMRKDCLAFLEWCAEHGIPLDEQSPERNGHDFWLTRNRHGAGFWDRGIDAGDALTEAAHVFGSADLYIGRNGWIHHE